MTQFKERVAVVTGAASGIGRHLALELARRGADLAICDIDQSGLEETHAQVESLGQKCFSSIVDVSRREDLKSFRDEVLEFFEGRVHLLFNNAGVALRSTVEDMDYDDLEWLMGINFWGVVYGTKLFLPVMKEMEDAHIINISSVFGLIGVPTQSGYNASKFAVRGFTESLRQEMLMEGARVQVSCVHPGGIQTPIARNGRMRELKAYSEKTNVEDEFDKLARTTPQRAAQIILDGVRANNPRILVGMDAVGMDWGQRIFPRIHHGFVVRAFKRNLKLK